MATFVQIYSGKIVKLAGAQLYSTLVCQNIHSIFEKSSYGVIIVQYFGLLQYTFSSYLAENPVVQLN